MPLLHTDDNLITPDVMAYIWNRIIEENKLDDLFYDGTVNDLKEWLNYIYNRNNYVTLVLDESGKIYHIVWINKFQDGQGFLHHCSLGNYNRKTWPTIKEYFKKMKVNGRSLIRTLMGVTPAINKKAVRLLSLIGWTILGEIPGICFIKSIDKNVPGIVSYVVINEV